MMKLSTAVAAAALSLTPAEASTTTGGGVSRAGEQAAARVDGKKPQSLAEYADARLDGVARGLAAEPGRIDLWKQATDLITTMAINPPASMLKARCFEVISLGDRYYSLSPQEALLKEDSLSMRARRGTISSEESAELKKLSSGYAEGREAYGVFLVQVVRLMAEIEDLGAANGDITAAAIASPAGGAIAAGELAFQKVGWAKLPLPVHRALLTLAAEGSALESLSAISISHQLGCPKEMLQPALDQFCADAALELSRGSPGPARAALRDLYETEALGTSHFNGVPSAEMLEVVLEIARSRRATAAEKIAAVSAVFDMLEPVSNASPLRELGDSISPTLIEATVNALSNGILEEHHLKRLERVFAPMYADFNSSKVHSAQILALLRSPDVREQAVGKMFFEALPGLHAQSHVPLKSDLRDAALELRRTPYENGETAAIRDYLERPCEHPAVRPSA